MSDIVSDKVSSEIPAGNNNDLLYQKAVNEPRAGELIKGKVLCIAKDVVIVDIGCKSEGHIAIKEFLDANGNPQVNIGDEIEAILESTDDEKGYLVLSKEKARLSKVWDEIEQSYKTGKAIQGRITQKIKAGFSVDINGINAFLPGSQSDIKPVNTPDHLVNNTFMFKVLQYDKIKPNIVVSRRALLEAEREITRKETAQCIEEGMVVEGFVKNIVNYGVFVDLGGIDGLLHINDISWGKVKNPSEIFNVGDKLSVKVVKFNKEDNRISLSLKQMKPNPWDTVGEKYKVGTKVKAKITSIMDYGAFAELEEGLEGLIHLSEISWAKIKHPSQKFKVGETIEVKILEIDLSNKKFSLSFKQLKPSLLEEMASKYPAGTRVKGIVKNIVDYGIFISIEDGVDGLAHISDISWKKIKHPSELFEKGQEIEAQIISLDKEKERFSLSIKVLEKDPWQGIAERYHAGISVSGKITGIANFGVFVELEDGLEGLIHISEFNRCKRKGIDLTVGDDVVTEVLNVDPNDKKIGLGFKGFASHAVISHIGEQQVNISGNLKLSEEASFNPTSDDKTVI